MPKPPATAEPITAQQLETYAEIVRGIANTLTQAAIVAKSKTGNKSTRIRCSPLHAELINYKRLLKRSITRCF